MRSWSIPMGRFLGVEIRLHFSFALLLGLFLLYTGMSGMAAIRGVSMWLLLLGVVLVRELARAAVYAYYDLEVRNLMLLPIGGLPSYATPESTEQASEGNAQLALAIVCPASLVAVTVSSRALLAGHQAIHTWPARVASTGPSRVDTTTAVASLLTTPMA